MTEDVLKPQAPPMRIMPEPEWRSTLDIVPGGFAIHSKKPMPSPFHRWAVKLLLCWTWKPYDGR